MPVLCVLSSSKGSVYDEIKIKAQIIYLPLTLKDEKQMKRSRNVQTLIYEILHKQHDFNKHCNTRSQSSCMHLGFQTQLILFKVHGLSDCHRSKEDSHTSKKWQITFRLSRSAMIRQINFDCY